MRDELSTSQCKCVVLEDTNFCVEIAVLDEIVLGFRVDHLGDLLMLLQLLLLLMLMVACYHHSDENTHIAAECSVPAQE